MSFEDFFKCVWVREREKVCVCTFLLIGPPPDSGLKCGRNLSSGQKFSSVVLTRALPSPSLLLSVVSYNTLDPPSLPSYIFSISLNVLQSSFHFFFSHSNHRPNAVTHELLSSNQNRLKYHPYYPPQLISLNLILMVNI